MPIHIKADKSAVADRALISGDPGRIRLLSSLLEETKLVNENRGFLVYTGIYKGKKVTMASHGIGGPSIAIVIEELSSLGISHFVRYGTAGSLVPEVNVGEFVIATGAYHNSGGLFSQYLKEDIGLSTSPDIELTYEIMGQFKNSNIPVIKGDVFSSDAFYAEDESFAKRWAERGVVAVEMELATLFMLGKLRKVRTAGVLIISDNLVKGGEWIAREELEERAIAGAKVVLEALIKV
ncbi:5'-methylthioadenosine phosphorylase [Sulfolobales archaeon HS-7]|nr:5'-methylthioadenosine phosphorylase [Sulfolobales archaeon HS-7]